MTVNYWSCLLVIQDQEEMFFSVLHQVEELSHWFMLCICYGKEIVNNKVTLYVCDKFSNV